MEQNDNNIVDIKQLGSIPKLIKMSVGMTAFGLMSFVAKVMQQNFRHTIWEDLYGRSVVFLICAIVDYIRQSGIISLFDIRPQIRFSFFVRVLSITLAYMFYFLAIFNTSSFVYVALMLCLLPLVCKVVQRNAMVENNFGFLDTCCLGVSVAGLFFLYRDNGNFTSDLTEQFDNHKAYIYGLAAVGLWSLANCLLHQNAIYVHYTIDTLYASLVSTIIVPGFIIAFFSFWPMNLTY